MGIEKFFFILVLLLMAGIANASAAPPVLSGYQADYIVKYDEIPLGRSVTTLKITGSHHPHDKLYKLCLNNITTVPFLRGEVSECSEGLVTLAPTLLVQPVAYHYLYQRGKNRQTVDIRFDWQKKIAITTTVNTRWRMPLAQNTQDKVSYQLALRLGLAKGQTHFDFPVADGGKIKHYRFQVLHTETIKTPWQSFQAIKLERLPMPNKEHVTVWSAPAIDYIFARVEQARHFVDVGTAEITAFQKFP